MQRTFKIIRTRVKRVARKRFSHCMNKDALTIDFCTIIYLQHNNFVEMFRRSISVLCLVVVDDGRGRRVKVGEQC